MKHFLNVIDCAQQLQVREDLVGFEKALEAVKVIKDQIQYRSQSLLSLARGYFSFDVLLVNELFMFHWTQIQSLTRALQNTVGALSYITR